MNNTKFVTAFYDIGRENWRSYRRSVRYYISRFHRMVNSLDNDFVLWTSEDLLEEIKKGIKKDNVEIKVFDFIEKYAKNIEVCKTIQNSEEFKKLCPEGKRNQCPEYYSPEYAALTSSKLDFVQRSIESGLIETPFTGWIDFGYITEDRDLWNKTRYECNWNDNRIRLFQRLKFDPEKVDVQRYMLTNHCVFSGGAMVGKKESFSEFLRVWYKVRKRYWDKNVLDDDQGWILASVIEKPELFECIFTNKEWRYLLNTGA